MSRPNLQVEELSDPEGEDDDNENGGSGDSRGKRKPNVLCQELSSLVALSLNTPPANSTEQQTAALLSSKWLKRGFLIVLKV